jgi:hypothetical protein
MFSSGGCTKMPALMRGEEKKRRNFIACVVPEVIVVNRLPLVSYTKSSDRALVRVHVLPFGPFQPNDSTERFGSYHQ